MAKLLKIEILGIRSFGPNEEDAQVIKFMSPVTLLLGENGCGKTTIIECLKFACTGDLPGGTKAGQGFVNDPKLNHSTFTKGYVKLKILDAEGNTVLISKIVKVEQMTFITQKFSTLDSTITIKKPNGEILPLSSRCADIGAQTCACMGVSKSILNNVLFCHQENSLWPLDEAKKLKEKFDEIFDATRYNTCIDSLKKTIKKESNDLKLLKEGLLYKRSIKEQVEREKVKLEEKEEKLKQFTEEIKNSEAELEPIQKRIVEICDLENNFVSLRTQFASKQSEKQNIEEQQNSIRAKLGEEFDGSDEDLKQAIAEFDKNYNKGQKEIEKLKNEKTSVESDEQNLNRIIQKCQVQLGQLQAGKKQQDDTVADRNLLIRNVLPDQCSGTDLSDNEKVKQLIDTFSGTVKQSKKSLDSLYDNFQKDEAKLQSDIDERLQNTTTFKQKICSNQNQLAEIRKKNREVNSQLKLISVSDEELKSYDSKITRIENDLKNILSTFNVEAVSNEIEKNRQDIRKAGETLEDLEKEYKLLQKNYTIENEIENRSHDLLKKENGIDGFKNNYYEELKQLFTDTPDGNFKMAILKIQQDNNKEITSMHKTIEIKTKEVTQLETKIKFERERLNALQKELRENEKKVSALCENKPYDTLNIEVEQNIDKLHKNRGQLSSAKIMYEKFIKEFRKEKPCCPVCETDFNNNNVVNKIVKRIESKIQDIPGELKKIEDELKKKQDFFNRVQQLKPVHERIEELKTALIPSIKEVLDELTEKHNNEEENLRKLNKDVIEPQNKVATCNKLIGDAALVDQYIIEVEKLKRHITDLETQLIKVNSNKSREQIESDINMQKIGNTELRQKYETNQKKLEQNRTKCQELREEKNRIIEKRLQLHKTMQGKPQLHDQLKENAEKEKELEDEIENLRAQLEPEGRKLEEAKANLNKAKDTNKNTVDKERAEHNELEKKFDDVQRLQRLIEIFYRKDMHGQFNAALELFTKNKSEMEMLQSKKDKVLEEIANLQRHQASHDFDKRKLEDNLDLRKKNKQVTQLMNEIKELNKRLGDFDYKSLQHKRNKLETQLATLQRSMAKKEGEKNELLVSINEMKTELNKPEKKQAYKIYMHKLYKHEITKHAVHDLKIFVEGIERAIIDFHKEKMTKINEAINELWRSIYRGNDIDYIQIKTEEGSRTGARRVYNYKVVQIKNNVELEMRGRCSAGQKVLACLIIRMALAETFSHNCGILALDEPTTNLDRDNVASLCETIAHMINTRRVQKSFQLLVITHDEEFIRQLSSIERLNVCYRVKRNNRGNTIIVQENI